MMHAEFVSWCCYMDERGSLDIGARFEMRTAEMMAMMASGMGAKRKDGKPFEPRDFLRYADATEDAAMAPDSVLSALTGGA